MFLLKSVAVTVVGICALATAVPIERRETPACQMVAVGGPKHEAKNPRYCEADLANQKHKVRCCAPTNPYPEGKWSKKSDCEVFAASFRMAGGSAHKACRKSMTFSDAAAYCASVNARLCTLQELSDGCTQGTGCGISKRYIWTSTSGGTSEPTTKTTTQEPTTKTTTQEPTTKTTTPEPTTKTTTPEPTTKTTTPEPTTKTTTEEPDIDVDLSTYQLVEKNGNADIDLEDLHIKGRTGWRSENSEKGFHGSSYYTWRSGDKFNIKNAGKHGLIELKTRISTAGYYQIDLHMYHDHPDSSSENDCFLQADDHKWEKIFNNIVGRWSWTTFVDHPGDHTNAPAIYYMDEGDHVVRISGRSKGLSIDKVRLTQVFPKPTQPPTVAPPPPVWNKLPDWGPGEAHLIEDRGKAALEIEDLGKHKGWRTESSIQGFGGSGYFNWRGGNFFDPKHAGKKGLIQIKVTISTPGVYQFDMRSYHNHPDTSEENDCFLKVDGSKWEKIFNNIQSKWDWLTYVDHPGDHTNAPAQYYFDEGAHLIQLSGRSNNLRLDAVRITRVKGK